ncbi:smad nuclear-interacting protein 1 [Neoarius graeffei]|uniref:smad nuclear-interacting protein 1 n=1 Tax=Neoarius graeffei TaxID=443677 RepID=UPI00298D541D|nr:smad nuclear-interacting protein 1 [Neoarius graeffei]
MDRQGSQSSMHCITVKEISAPPIIDVLKALESDFNERTCEEKYVSQDDVHFIQFLNSNIRQKEDSHLEMPLLFKTNSLPWLPNNKKLAIACLQCLKRKLKASKQYYDHYRTLMEEMISKGRERHGDGSREWDAHLYQQQQAEREQHNEHCRENRQRQEARDGNETHAIGGGEEEETAPAAEKEKPSFELSGALVEDTNTYRGVVIKYNEPPEARIPKRRWRLYPFKNDDPLPVMYIHRQSAYLLGRQRRIADIPTDHPSCSKQHAVFQYRFLEFTRADGATGKRVRPCIIGLGSSNGT